MEKTSFKELLNRNVAIISKICRVYAEDSFHFEDLFQEVSYHLYKSLSSFEGRSKESTWVYKVALNVCLSETRKSQKKIQTSPIIEGYDAYYEHNEHQTEQLKILYDAIKKLKEIDRAIILLYLEEKKYKEIAGIIGIETTLVGVKISRIKSQLKALMNGR